MRGLMAALADLVEAVARDGIDEDAHAISDAMADDVRLAVEVTAGSVDVVEALGSLSLLGRIEQLRDIAVTGPIPLDEVESVPDDATTSTAAPQEPGVGEGDGEGDAAVDDSTASAIDRIRRLLGST
jgi:hypothetical protein